MDPVQYLLEEVQRTQCLVYLAREEDEPTPVRELMEALHVSPGLCRACLGALTREGFVRLIPSATHPLPRAVRLTARGRAEVQEWQANARTERLHLGYEDGCGGGGPRQDSLRVSAYAGE